MGGVDLQYYMGNGLLNTFLSMSMRYLKLLQIPCLRWLVTALESCRHMARRGSLMLKLINWIPKATTSIDILWVERLQIFYLPGVRKSSSTVVTSAPFSLYEDTRIEGSE